MDEVNHFRERRILKEDGDIEFDILTVDDIGLPPYPIATQSGGYPKRINEIINMDTRPDDIILATFPKSGASWKSEMAVVKYFREGRIFRKDGEIEFDIFTVDGIGLAPYPLPGGYPKRINDIINMDTRPDDIILATFPKSGTHWMREILEMLVRGQAEYSKDKLVIPLELAADMNMINSLPSPRVLHTHLPYKWFPRKHIENGGKIIHCIRNPKDTYVSYFHHSSKGLEFGQKTKGMTWAQFFDNCVIGKACLCGTWFDNAKEMDLAKRNNKNIYTVQYEKLKEDQSREIKAIATFLGISVTDDLVKNITEKCVFENLKYAYEEIKEYPQELQKLIKEHHEAVKDFKHPNIFRKGVIGDWKNHFTVAQNEQFDTLYQKEMEGVDIGVAI